MSDSVIDRIGAVIKYGKEQNCEEIAVTFPHYITTSNTPNVTVKATYKSNNISSYRATSA